jgi:hypothetical protein
MSICVDADADFGGEGEQDCVLLLMGFEYIFISPLQSLHGRLFRDYHKTSVKVIDGQRFLL